MGCCSSKENSVHRDRDGRPDPNQMIAPSTRHRTSITYIKPRNSNGLGGLARVVSSETSKSISLGGLKIRYGYLSQRGYYPDEENKPNQDSFSISNDFARQSSDALLAVYDGHGRDGDKCARFASDHLPNILSRHIRKAKKSLSSPGEVVEDVELNKERTQAAINAAHKQCNKAMHSSATFEDALSGTTAISAYIQGRMNRITISNVGDSRAVLGQRIRRGDPLHGKDDSFRALPLSRDQTPYRSGERKRVKACGARVLSLDQIEGLEPVRDDEEEECMTDFELGEEIDEGGDPPRVWHSEMDYPGTAFTRSLGDELAEELGVIAEPEMVTRELKHGDEIIVLASDGVFEFLTNQSVIDICAKFNDPLEACQAVIAQSYELWLQYELRTDDITMICIFVDQIDSSSANLFKSMTNGRSDYTLSKDASDDFVREDNRGKTTGMKSTRRLVEMRALLEESLMDVPDPGKGFDIQKLFTEKTDADKECINRAAQASVMLQSMSTEQMEMICGVIQPLSVKKGDWIIRQREEGDCFYIIEEGQFEARISQNPEGDDDGGEVVHKYHGSRESHRHPSFGELSLLYSAPRAATVIAKTDGKLWALHRNALKAILFSQHGKKELVKVLQSITELQDFRDEEIQDFASSMEEVSFKKDSKITESGKEGSTLYVVSKGRCVINLEAEGEILSSTLKEMDYFGQEMMASGRYLATVETLSDTVCWKLEKKTILYSMKKIQAVREGRTTIQ